MPGTLPNIRELQNCLERAVIVSPGPVLQVPLDDLRSGALPRPEPGQRQTLAESERALILATLQETNSPTTPLYLTLSPSSLSVGKRGTVIAPLHPRD